MFERGNIKLHKSFLCNFLDFKDYSTQGLYLSRNGDWINCHMYDNLSEVLYDFSFNFNGDIDISSGDIFTGEDVSYAFCTKEGKIINNNAISFKSIVTLSKEFRNESILKLNRGGFFAKYHCNHGVIDFRSGHTSGTIGRVYTNFLSKINPSFLSGTNSSCVKEDSTFKERVFDNYGVILGKELQASNKDKSSFKFNNRGYFCADSFYMNAKSSSISTPGCFSVIDTVQGNISDINVGRKTIRIGQLVTNSYINNFDNSGRVVFDKSTNLEIKNLKNSGVITGLENLTILTEALSGGGVITAEGALDLIYKTKREIIQKKKEGVTDIVKLNNLLLSKNAKWTIRIDHYLNTITDYYYRNGGFSHREETGYIFQNSTEEEQDIPLPAQAAEALSAILSEACAALDALDNAYRTVDSLGEAVLKGMLAARKKHGSTIPQKIALSEALNASGYSSADRSAAVNTLLSVPYSANVLRSSGDIADIFSNPFVNFDELYKEYSDYKYELDRAAERSRRKSWNDADHVRVIKDASYDLSMESLVANATRVRYEVEKWKERNPESYENFLKIVRLYNNAALAGTAFSAILSAPETGGASLLTFGLSASLLAGIEFLADFIAEESADRIAQYCAKGDKAKESSYLKTCDFIIQFAAENGLIAAGRVKILKESVKKVGDRYPRNAEYAGREMSVQEVGECLDKYYGKKVPNPYQHGIPFTAAGFPDFSRYSIRKVQINVTGNHGIDKKLADKAAGFSVSNPRPKDYVWHHHEDGKTMLLIPRDLNAAIAHTGGAAVKRNKK